ncbi:MAG: YncE family protein [Blastocatellia bacterium]
MKRINFMEVNVGQGPSINQKVAEIKVGDEPNNPAITPNGQTVYVADTVSGTVSVINAASQRVDGTILVGTDRNRFAGLRESWSFEDFPPYARLSDSWKPDVSLCGREQSLHS